MRWVVERSLRWISHYHRLNPITERAEAHLIAFIEIAFISILSHRLVRLDLENQRLMSTNSGSGFFMQWTVMPSHG
jgi:hypothetical protein